MLFGLYYAQRLRNRQKLQHLQVQLAAQERQAQEKQAEAYQQEKLLQVQQRLESERLPKTAPSQDHRIGQKEQRERRQNRLLQKLKDKIASIETRSPEPSRRWAEMSRLLDGKPIGEDHTFEIQIDELNQEFLHRLKGAYPTLTTYDLRLATYLKMGLSSREIAELLNVLPSSVNVSRSRLRKKLNLDAERDL